MNIRQQFRTSIQHSNSLAFGCSHTLGVGVDANETWAHYIGAKNFGVGGASSDLVARIAPDIINAEQPTTVFVLWPCWTRFEYIQENNYFQSLPTDANRIYFMKTHNDQWCMKNFAKQVQIVQDICCKQSIQCVDMSLYDLIPYMDHADRWPVSKLGHHYAPVWHQRVAKLFLWAKNNNHKFPIAYE